MRHATPFRLQARTPCAIGPVECIKGYNSQPVCELSKSRSGALLAVGRVLSKAKGGVCKRHVSDLGWQGFRTAAAIVWPSSTGVLHKSGSLKRAKTTHSCEWRMDKQTKVAGTPENLADR